MGNLFFRDISTLRGDSDAVDVRRFRPVSVVVGGRLAIVLQFNR